MAEYDVYCGLGVGKGDHHAVAFNPDGKRLHDRPLPNDKQRLRTLFAKLAQHGRFPVVVDQPATIGALPVTVARACGLEWRTCRGWPCAVSLTCIRERRASIRVARFLIRDRDGTYPALFNTILADTGITVVLTGVRMPRMKPLVSHCTLLVRCGGLGCLRWPAFG